MKYQAVLFDLGNTLLEYGLHGHWKAFLRQRLEEVHGLVCAAASEKQVSAALFVEQAAEVIGGEHARGLMHSGVSWHLADRLREAMRRLGVDCDDAHVTRVMEEFYQPIRESTRRYPDTVETLQRLRGAGFKMAVISNTPWDGPGYLTHGDMEKWGLGGYFEATLFSGDLPWRKPHPEFMWEAARRLGVGREGCVVVGNDLASDIGGANAAGMASIWMDRDRSSGPEPWASAQPDVTVDTLTQAADYIERLNA